MQFSIIIPALNEKEKIRADIEAASDFLASEGLRGEIILVDDGSTDGTADEARRVAVPDGVAVEVIRHETNLGKGRAVRDGMKATSGEQVMFADSGCCIPYANALLGLELIRTGECEVAHGSRKLPESIIHNPQHLHRRIASWLFRRLVSLVTDIPSRFTDTQCGFKVYRGDVARELFDECESDGFMFDIEVMLRAFAKGYRVVEFPVEWTSDRDTRLRAAPTALRVLSELRQVKRAVDGAETAPEEA